MKKYFIVAAALFTLSCQSDDTKAKEQENQVGSSSNALVGKWKVVGQSVNGEKREFGEGAIQFKENGDFIGITGGVFKFKINADSLILTSAENKKTEKSKIELSEVEKGTLKLQTLVKDTFRIETVFQKTN